MVLQPKESYVSFLRYPSGKWQLVVAIALTTGCSSSPRRYYPPAYDAEAIGVRAVTSLDVDGDHLLDAKELAASPALLADITKLDRNGDKRLSAAEIGAKVDEWTESRVGAVAALCVVKRGGQPVSNVQVRFIPEAFLGDVIKPATGVTDASGVAPLTAEGQKFTGVMNCGYYRVELSLAKDGKETISSKFNALTVLGAEVRQKMEVNIEFDIAK